MFRIYISILFFREFIINPGCTFVPEDTVRHRGARVDYYPSEFISIRINLSEWNKVKGRKFKLKKDDSSLISKSMGYIDKRNAPWEMRRRCKAGGGSMLRWDGKKVWFTKAIMKIRFIHDFRELSYSWMKNTIILFPFIN